MSVYAARPTPPQEARDAAATLRTVFLERFGRLRQAVRAAAAGDGRYPIDAAGWIAAATDAIDAIGEALRDRLERDGRTVRDFASCEAFLGGYAPGSDGCLLIDAYLAGMGGLELLLGCAGRAIRCPRS